MKSISPVTFNSASFAAGVVLLPTPIFPANATSPAKLGVASTCPSIAAAGILLSGYCAYKLPQISTRASSPPVEHNETSPLTDNFE